MSKTNPRITKRERGLIVGGIRRTFSRSELRQKALAVVRVPDYHSAERPRVKKWSRCLQCQTLIPEYLMEVDHMEPRIPLDKSAEDMTLEEIVDRTWCDERLLQAICKDCHLTKTKAENSERRLHKKGKKK